MFQPCSSHWSRGHWSKTWTTPCRLSLRNQIHTIYGTTNHPKSSKNIQTLRFFWGKIFGGLFCCCIPFPPFFFGEKTSQIKGETSPLGPFTLLGTPTKPTESKTNPGSLQEVGRRLRGWNDQIYPRVSGAKKKPCKKVWPEVGNVEIYTNTSWNCIQTCFFFWCFFGQQWRKMIFQRNKILRFVFLVKAEFFFSFFFCDPLSMFGPKAIPTSFIYPFGMGRVWSWNCPCNLKRHEKYVAYPQKTWFFTSAVGSWWFAFFTLQDGKFVAELKEAADVSWSDCKREGNQRS